MKRYLIPLITLPLWLVLTAMGGQPPGEAPKPEISFEATIIDDQNISTRCREVTWQGKIFFIGTRGKGVVSIPFAKVKTVKFIGNAVGGKKDAQVTLKNGEVVAVSFDTEARLYGVTSFGSYKIYARNLKEIIFD